MKRKLQFHSRIIVLTNLFDTHVDIFVIKIHEEAARSETCAHFGKYGSLSTLVPTGRDKSDLEFNVDFYFYLDQRFAGAIAASV